MEVAKAQNWAVEPQEKKKLDYTAPNGGIILEPIVYSYRARKLVIVV
jgi:hypothetical protein